MVNEHFGDLETGYISKERMSHSYVPEYCYIIIVIIIIIIITISSSRRS